MYSSYPFYCQDSQDNSKPEVYDLKIYKQIFIALLFKIGKKIKPDQLSEWMNEIEPIPIVESISPLFS